jgi:hypothetical protein
LGVYIDMNGPARTYSAWPSMTIVVEKAKWFRDKEEIQKSRLELVQQD